MTQDATDFVCFSIFREMCAADVSEYRLPASDLAWFAERKAVEMVEGNTRDTWHAVAEAALLYIASADWVKVSEYLIDRTERARIDWPEEPPCEFVDDVRDSTRPEYAQPYMRSL